jgi:hypothetical protein
MISIYEQILNKMLSYVNKTKDDIKSDREFYFNNRLTKSQYDEWYEYSLNLLCQNFPNENQLVLKRRLDLFDVKYGILYIYQRAPEKLSPEIEEMITNIKQKKLGKDTTLKDLTK